MKDLINRLTSRKFLLAVATFTTALTSSTTPNAKLTVLTVVTALYAAVNVYEKNGE